MARKTPPKAPKLAGPFDFTYGAFSVSKYRVPFFSSVLTFAQAAEHLALVTDDPKYADLDWTLDELYQRELNYDRVFSIADEYLGADLPQFFNSLTVVLRPKDATTSHASSLVDDSRIKEKAEILTPVGPIVVGFDKVEGYSFVTQEAGYRYPETWGAGRLWWIHDAVQAVAIDGQHRLAAVKRFCNRSKNKEAASRSSLSIVFLILDPSIGLVAPREAVSKPEDALRLMRKIFIDLNKHAVPVSRARNILLDDLDPKARFVRGLLSNSLDLEIVESPVYDFDTFPYRGKSGEFEICVPLNMVDWHGEERSKIESGPYVTSVLALDWIISTLLDGSLTIPSMDDVEEPETYYRKIASKFKKEFPKTYRERIQEELEYCERAEVPYRLAPDVVDSLANEFKETWNRAIVYLLTRLAPYSDLVRRRIELRTTGPKFAQWTQRRAQVTAYKKSRAHTYYKERLEEIEDRLRKEEIFIDFKNAYTEVEESKKDNIFFYLVGQRALILAFREIQKDRDVEPAALAKACGRELQEFGMDINLFCAWYLLEGLNKIHETSVETRNYAFSRHLKVNRPKNSCLPEQIVPQLFWAGSIVNRDNKDNIDFSKNAAKRASRWLVLIAHLHAWSQFSPENRTFLKKNCAYGALCMRLENNEDLISKALAKALERTRYDGNTNCEAPAEFLARSYGSDEESDASDLPTIETCATLVLDERLRYLAKRIVR